jgi:hypothetical protein
LKKSDFFGADARLKIRFFEKIGFFLVPTPLRGVKNPIFPKNRIFLVRPAALVF